MAYTDPYEEWKATHGGSGSGYVAPVAAPAAPTTPTAPLPPPPPPNAQPRPRAPSSTPLPPPPPPPTLPRQTAQPLNTQLGTTGQTIEQRFAQQRANSDWRDTNVDPNQWGAWEEEERKRVEAGTSANQNGQCPPDKPFTGRNGQCAFKPDDCPDGMHVVGTPGTCVPDGPGGAGGTAGQGGTGQGGSGTAAGAGGLDAMTEYWKNLTQQSGSRYTPEAVAALEADQFSRARAQEKNQLAQAQQDQALRGVSRSANQNAAVRQIGVGTGQQIMANRADIQKRKIDADYQDKQAAIKNAQDWVNSMRDYMLRGDMNAIQREQIAAQIRLAQMNISAQSSQLEQQYQNNLALNYATGNTGV